MSHFFGSGRKYAVLGASTSPFKFGNRILKWYINHQLPAIPVNPRSDTVLGLKAYKTLNEFLETEDDHTHISVSVVTSPHISYELFKEVKEGGNADKISAVWFQPGSYDSKVVEYVRNEIGISGEDNLISDGECILVSGVSKMRAELKSDK